MLVELRCVGTYACDWPFLQREQIFTSYLIFTSGLSEPEFCGDLVCGFGGVVGGGDFPCRFGGIVVRCGGIGCGMGVVRRAACLVVGPVGVGSFACLFGCTTVGRTSGWVAVPS